MLKIKVFPDDLDSKKSKQTIKEIKNEFKLYLDTPMDIESKINEGVFKYSRKRPSPNDNDVKCESATNEKKPKLIDSEQLTRYLQSDTPFSPHAGTPTSYLKKPTNTNHVETHQTNANKQSDNQKFFSQFLTDQTKIPKPFSTPSYFSPMDYPWFYPPYFYAQKFCASSKPPPLVPHQPPPPLTPVVTPPDTEKNIKQEKGDTLSPQIDERKTRTRSTTNSLPNQIKKGNKQNGKEPKEAKQGKNEKQSKQTLKTVSSKAVKKKDNSRKDEQTKKALQVKNESESNIEKTKTKAMTTDYFTKPAQMTASEKRLRNKDNLKFRYSLRQRAKALRKAKKLAKLHAETQPKIILKKLDKKTSTKKELFLANFGLRRVLKRIQNPPPPLVQDKPE